MQHETTSRPPSRRTGPSVRLASGTGRGAAVQVPRSGVARVGRDGEEEGKLPSGEGLLDEGYSLRQGDAVSLPLPVPGHSGIGPRPLRPGQTLVQVRSPSERRFGEGIPLRTGTETPKGARSYVMWVAWALMEAKQGEMELMRRLFNHSLKVKKDLWAVPRDVCPGGQLNPRGRYAYLSWGCIEQKEGRLDEARKLFLQSAASPMRSVRLTDAMQGAQGESGRRCLAAGPGTPGGAVRELRRGAEAFSEGEHRMCRSDGRIDRFCVAQSIDVNPRHLHAWQAWGIFESQQGNHERARELFQSGIWASPNSRNAAVIFEVRSASGCSLPKGRIAAGVGADGGGSRRPGSGADAVQVRRQGGSAQRSGVECLDPPRGDG